MAGRCRCRPTRLEVPQFHSSRLTTADAQSDDYLYPDELFVYRKQALAAAAKHNFGQTLQAGRAVGLGRGG